MKTILSNKKWTFEKYPLFLVFWHEIFSFYVLELVDGTANLFDEAEIDI